MTGQELFHALSFVDEQYIDEADQARVSSGTPWRKILSAAACLCILIAGAFAMRNLGAVEKDAAPEAAAPAAPMEAITEAAMAEEAPTMSRDETETEAAAEPELPLPVGEETASGELQHIPYARLRVLEILDEGSFEAIVEADEPMEMDTQVTVVVDPSKVPGADAEVQNDLRGMHTDAQIEIKDGAYDAGSNTLYVAEVIFLCRDDHE